jgi:hypothetical protein
MLKISRIILCCLMVFLGQHALAQEQQYDSVQLKAIKYSKLNEDVKWLIDRRRNNLGFNESVGNSVFLSKVSPFLNQRWMTKSDFSSRKPLILDAKISPYVSVASWTMGSVKSKRYMLFAFYLNPEFEVRIFKNDYPKGDSSLPVRTATSRPGGELFFTFNSLYQKGRPRNIAFSVKAFHHSNGQDGEEFNSIDRKWGKRGYFNTYNGNFSDDFVIEGNAMLFNTHDFGKREQFLKFGMTFSTDLSDWMRYYNVYGRRRINFLYSKTWSTSRRRTITDNVIREGDAKPKVYITSNYFLIEKFRFEFFSSFITSKMNVGPVYNLSKASLSDRINVHATLHYRIPGFSAAAFFGEVGYYGQDTYNGYFQRSSFFAKGGISFGLFKYPKQADDIPDESKTGKKSATTKASN